jgi:hypothetical protein
LKNPKNSAIIYIESEERKNLPLRKKYWVATDARKVIIMTKREFLNSIINGTLNDETAEFAAKELAQMDAGLEKRRNTLSPKQEENLKLVETVVAQLGAEPLTATAVYELGVEGVTSVQKASSLLRMAVKNGLAAETEVVVKGKGKQKGYIAANCVSCDI